MPGDDHFLILASKNFDRLSRYFTLATPPWGVLQRVIDRSQAYDLAQEAGVKTPRAFLPNDLEEMTQIISELDFKGHSYILKTPIEGLPIDVHTGRFTRDGGPSAASMLESCEEIYSRIGQYPRIEEVVPGESDQSIGVSMVVDRNHEPVLWYCVRRLKLFLYSRNRAGTHPYELGGNVYCESIHDDEAVEAAKRFVRQACSRENG